MKKLSLVTTLLVLLPLSTFVVACDSGEDTDARAALEKEALERELDLALQPDTTAEPEFSDVAIEQPEAIEAPPSAAPRQSTAPRQNPTPRPTTPRPSTPSPAPAPEPSAHGHAVGARRQHLLGAPE